MAKLRKFTRDWLAGYAAAKKDCEAGGSVETWRASAQESIDMGYGNDFDKGVLDYCQAVERNDVLDAVGVETNHSVLDTVLFIVALCLLFWSLYEQIT